MNSQSTAADEQAAIDILASRGYTTVAPLTRDDRKRLMKAIAGASIAAVILTFAVAVPVSAQRQAQEQSKAAAHAAAAGILTSMLDEDGDMPLTSKEALAAARRALPEKASSTWFSLSDLPARIDGYAANEGTGTFVLCVKGERGTWGGYDTLLDKAFSGKGDCADVIASLPQTTTENT